jgi:hypothetical protein
MTTNDYQQLKKTGPYGYASLVWHPRTGNLVVTLSLTGLLAARLYSAAIRLGNCTEAGPVVYPLPDVLADGHGNAFTTTTIPGVATGIPPSGWYIAVYGDPGLATLQQVTPVYCGNITNASPNTNHVQIIRVRLA